MSAPRALVTGAAGQDGSYLVELLRDRGYEVTGVVRDPAADVARLPGVELVNVDFADAHALESLLRRHGPDELYHLAAPTSVPESWADPAGTVRSVAGATAALLAAVAAVGRRIRFFQASSREVFGVSAGATQSERTPRSPINPYGAAKACADFLVSAYRRRDGLHANSGILFNHESPRRPPGFLPSKVARAVAAISVGLESSITLGDLDARRDWGYAPDYVDAMWRMLQQPEPSDYVIATGELHSVQELVTLAFAHVGLDWQDHVQIDDTFRRGREHVSAGDAAKARRELGWAPSLTFDELVALLVDEALAGLQTSS